jgi:hypothetical protein
LVVFIIIIGIAFFLIIDGLSRIKVDMYIPETVSKPGKRKELRFKVKSEALCAGTFWPATGSWYEG